VADIPTAVGSNRSREIPPSELLLRRIATGFLCYTIYSLSTLVLLEICSLVARKIQAVTTWKPPVVGLNQEALKSPGELYNYFKPDTMATKEFLERLGRPRENDFTLTRCVASALRTQMRSDLMRYCRVISFPRVLRGWSAEAGRCG
jgi:hypothetical protein